MSFLPHIFGQRKEHPVTSLRSQLDNVFDNFLADWPAGFGDLHKTMTDFGQPPVDVAETKDTLEIKADLPDMEEKDIGLELQGDSLVLSGYKAFKDEDNKDKGFHRIERAYGSFKRVIPLPFTNIDENAISAHYKNGVLTVTIQKSEPEQNQRPGIKINFDQ